MAYPDNFASASVCFSPNDGHTTYLTGRLYFFAKIQSLSSCAGTAMTAPVPYPPKT